MKRLSWVLLCLSVVGCSAALEKAVEKNPDIVFNAIKSNPKKFIEVVNEAAKSAQMEARKEQEENSAKELEEEFKNPKKPAIDDTAAIFGNASAPITIVEYSDFQCPYCVQGFQNLKEVRKMYGDKVRVVYKHLPLPGHPLAMPAAKYFEAVRLQAPEKAEKFHDEIFTRQQELNKKQEDFLKEVAKKVGANMARLMKDLESEVVSKKIAADMEEAHSFGFEGTPGFLVNGVSIRGAYPPPFFQRIIDRHLGGEAKPE